MVGDLKNGRTARSLCYLLAKFDDNQIFFISPKKLKIEKDIKKYFKRKNVKYLEGHNLNNILSHLDIVYMTRIQKERMDEKTYNQTNGIFVINKKNFKLINKNSRVLHPLPHVEEIQLPINVEETDPRVAYFRQA